VTSPPFTRLRKVRAQLASLAALLVATTHVAGQRTADPDAWRRGGVCYEVFVRSFADSDGDGVGDLNGLTARLDYINDGAPARGNDLGANCVWLMPVAESPSYHGYDVADYYRVDREYGTNQDFQRFVAAAHRRGIRVLVDMVLNHTSSQNPWFQEALRDTAAPHRTWFRFSPTPQGKGPWGAEAWHRSPVRDEYYYGVFWRGMPDLNYDTPAVRDEAKRIARFWLQEMGVDGFRLDAIPYLVEEGSVLAGSRGTHAFLHEYGDYVRRFRPGTFTVGEVWDSVTALQAYYPDQLDAYFPFELAATLISRVNRGSAGGLLDPFLRMQQALPAERWSPFLSNHDQTRVMTALGGDPGRARLAAALLLTLPGFPFVYYGEEIGMTGDKAAGDERLRTPMQWAAGPGGGFTRGTPWEASQPDSARVTVAAQEHDPQSLLNLYRRLIHLRSANPALGSGTLVPLNASDSSVVAYLRRAPHGAVLVVANLAARPVEGASLSSAAGSLPGGRYVARVLLGASGAPRLTADAAGGVAGFHPAPRLGPHEFLILELSPVR
jgi:alpha-amylase